MMMDRRAALPTPRPPSRKGTLKMTKRMKQGGIA
ncbi:hypothetical protein DSW25_00110 [Sulfitobacter donghicola DSW-25 = KCTC 12864 = JCM 14565]|uniref:Uncharacterized protein n=1 Tax=Sulfitobacter donghicola DSW-25 = KCTC 12864 = JCM 14565 TaxID=1300350 RepID=A0A073J081_9RHOB|nr:hypothetical protein DSW25_00110 [Sulfitobacter donghicola DSW-25 = KCTC 12864 = JCM 14565]